MIFNSLTFLIFLVIVFGIYWSLSKRPLVYQNILLLLASYVFYSWWDWRFLALIVFSTLVDFYIGKAISNSSSRKTKKLFLYLSLITNLGLLGFFKYYNFFVDSFADMIAAFGLNIDTWTLNIILPVGISFYTFQTLSYTIDIYKGQIKHTDNYISFAVFVSFFPQLVAGPIERASHLLPQFLNKRVFNYKEAVNGLSLIVYGFFKKLVIADRLAIYVNSVFSDINNANSISLTLGAVFFAFQIYADFSGYSLIARGVSKLLGFDLMVNFNRPYLATNIPDFWRRWHISLSTWFRDYLYIPLGGNRVSVARNYYNLMIVFLVSGLWHGANWTFVVWGALHGLYQILYVFSNRLSKFKVSTNKMFKGLKIIFVFILVTVTWVFFRAESISQALEYYLSLFRLDFTLNLVQICAEKGPLNLLISLFSIFLLYISYLLPLNLEFKKEKYSIYFILLTIFIILLIGVNGTSEFIYFQF